MSGPHSPCRPFLAALPETRCAGRYDGSRLALTGDVVIVVVQYRVGSLGWLYHPAAGIQGNLGIEDQRLAFQWVQREIRSFGGDASQVTVFGESAGAISLCVHASSPASAGLFHAAIMESAVCDSAAFFSHASTAATFGAPHDFCLSGSAR